MNRRPETIFLSFIPLPPSNLRPFGAPPSIGRRECPREPLPLEGAAEHSEAGFASFFGGARVLSLIVDLRCISSRSFIPLSPSNLRPFGAPPSIGRRECPREPLPLEGAAERSEAGLASFFAALGCSRIMAHLRRSPRSFSYRFPHPTSAPSGHLLPEEGGSVHASPFPWKGLPSTARRGWLPFSVAKPPPLCLPHWGRLCQGKRYPCFFIRPTQKRPSLTSGRFYVYYLLRETLIKSQNSISHVFSCNASSYSSLNSSLFASKYSLHCMKI